MLSLHDSSQETSTGNGTPWIEPEFQARSLIVNVTQISVNLLGSVTLKAQHSPDGSTWIDIPNMSTSGLSATGAITISVSPAFSTLGQVRVVWTFNNANSITFTAFVTGD